MLENDCCLKFFEKYFIFHVLKQTTLAKVLSDNVVVIFCLVMLNELKDVRMMTQLED